MRIVVAISVSISIQMPISMIVSMAVVTIGIIITVTVSWSCLSFGNLVVTVAVRVRIVRIFLVYVTSMAKEVLVGVWSIETVVVIGNTGFEILAIGAIICFGVGTEAIAGMVFVCGGVKSAGV